MLAIRSLGLILSVVSIDDTSSVSLVKAHPQLQHRCMLNMIGFHAVDVLRCLSDRSLLLPTTIPDNECTWKGIDSVSGRIHTIHWNSNSLDNLGFGFWAFLGWLPVTLETVLIRSMSCHGPFVVKQLPPKLIKFSVTDAHLSGTLDLTDLPQNMEVFNMSGNIFSGTIWLTDLPDTLMLLDVTNNQLARAIVKSRSIPENCTVRVDSQKGGNLCEILKI